MSFLFAGGEKEGSLVDRLDGGPGGGGLQVLILEIPNGGDIFKCVANAISS